MRNENVAERLHFARPFRLEEERDDALRADAIIEQKEHVSRVVRQIGVGRLPILREEANTLGFIRTLECADRAPHQDLGATFDIDSIALWNRTDCCDNRLANFFVSVLAAGTSNVSDPNAATVWTQLFSGTAGVHEAFMPGGVQGQYVKVQYNHHANYLQLAEVEVTPVVVSTTPEPAGLALVASGLLAFGGVSLLRRKTR